MARTVIVLNNPVLKLADTEAGLTTGDAYECQITEAKVVATANLNTIPSTGCAPASQSPGKTSYALQLTWLQDWNLDGLSQYAFANDTQPKWFEFTLDSVGAPTTKMTGQAYVVAGSYGGVFGDGSAATSDQQTWPCLDKPAVTVPVATAAAASSNGTSTTAGK
jgi:hypothetical protein